VIRSIRERLLLGLLPLVVLLSGFAGIVSYRRVLAETSTLFDYQLRQLALSLRDEASIGPGIVLPAHPSDSDVVIQIWDLLGATIYRSPPGMPFINQAILGYADMTLAGERWRVYSLQTTDGVIQVAQPWRVRESLARGAALRVVLPLLLLLVSMAIAVTWIVGRGLAPLRRVAGEVERRNVGSLAPIEIVGLPQEVAPLIEELNRLLARLGEAFGKQRAFVADAAHELRSPLTALSLQLQLLDRAPDESARKAAQERLGAAVERAAHLVGQLLTLARNEPESAPARLVPVVLEASVRDGIADLSALAAERSVELVLEVAASPAVLGDADALRILVRNLVDNAVRYSPSGGKVEVRVFTQARAAALEVDDAGPGIPVEERDRAFDRFYRRSGSAQGGSGLGLAIVKAIAERHGARVTLGEAPAGGLRATVMFPPYPP
jgi:two-component system OmpR family sensor kinase/two-component system sensor histidine kinase QseC